jgi:hypothetical protein
VAHARRGAAGCGEYRVAARRRKFDYAQPMSAFLGKADIGWN